MCGAVAGSSRGGGSGGRGEGRAQRVLMIEDEADGAASESDGLVLIESGGLLLGPRAILGSGGDVQGGIGVEACDWPKVHCLEARSSLKPAASPCRASLCLLVGKVGDVNRSVCL
jgi:hypothetical protein